MTAHSQNNSAKIYAFPVRPVLHPDRRIESVRDGVKPGLPRVTTTEYGTGWYHDAAVQEADRDRNR